MNVEYFVIEGGKVRDGQLIGGRRYSPAEWDQKQRDQRIEAKLDAIMIHLGLSITAAAPRT